MLHHLDDAGVTFPSDISLVGFHENELSLAKHPRLSVINRAVSEIGEVAGRMMLQRLADPDQPALVETLPTWFVIGESSDPRLVSRVPAPSAPAMPGGP